MSHMYSHIKTLKHIIYISSKIFGTIHKYEIMDIFNVFSLKYIHIAHWKINFNQK